jgi:hypothetical protein
MEWVDKAHTKSVATLNGLQPAECATMEHGNPRGALWRLPPTHQLERHHCSSRCWTACARSQTRPRPPLSTKPRPPTGTSLREATLRCTGCNVPGAPYYVHPPAPAVNPHDPRTRPAPTPPVVSQTVTSAPSAPLPVSQAAHVAPAPVSPAPPVSGTPAAAPGDPKPTAREAPATTSTGVDTGAAPKRREEYPTEQILVDKDFRQGF